LDIIRDQLIRFQVTFTQGQSLSGQKCQKGQSSDQKFIWTEKI